MEDTAETQETVCPAREGKEPARGPCLPCPQPFPQEPRASLSRAAQVRAENTASPGKGDCSHVSSSRGKSQRLAIRDALWRQSIFPPGCPDCHLIPKGMPLKRLIMRPMPDATYSPEKEEGSLPPPTSFYLQGCRPAKPLAPALSFSQNPAQDVTARGVGDRNKRDPD